jgi:hypothetical protein
LALSYEIVTHDRTGRERVHPYSSENALGPGSIVLLGGRYWLVERTDQAHVQTQPARYRLMLRHPDGRQEAGAFRRYRLDAPVPGHRLTTLDDGAPISWVVVEDRLAYDAAGEPFLELIAEHDSTEAESLPDHQLEHALDQDRDGTNPTAAALMRAESAGLAMELVGLEAGQAADWDGAESYLHSLILEEIEDDLFEQCGVDTRRDPHQTWLETVKGRLHDDLDSFRAGVEAGHGEIEEWDFRGGRIFAAVGRIDDDSIPLSAFGWICQLVDAGVLQAGGFKRVRKPLLLV